ncbi:hypothetical protein [Cellulosilyticum sp. I15G10I2]|uniref:hypothetical protein n=1 Tax=Cellulosilyticum sp. I15G10I2 TaxID=1892843 RepID=UPI00085BBD35|nr:hypothetical protein [Cellulosilyticum sp. I15G10I2]
MKEKVLVCITIQENSRRLISQGFNIAETMQAPLHILHVRRGETIFDNPESSNLLEDLFGYGSELGGEVHFLCSNNITQTILDFIINNHITHLVLGEAPIINELGNQESVYEQLTQNLPDINVAVLSREDYKFQEA